jgi:hypothetical protein
LKKRIRYKLKENAANSTQERTKWIFRERRIEER